MSWNWQHRVWHLCSQGCRLCQWETKVSLILGYVWGVCERLSGGDIPAQSLFQECENISNEFQIFFETHFLLLETLLDRNKLTAHFPVKPNSRSEF